MSASSRYDLGDELDRNDETRNDVDLDDGDFPALKHNYDQREHAHHSTLTVLLHERLQTNGNKTPCNYRDILHRLVWFKIRFRWEKAFLCNASWN